MRKLIFTLIFVFLSAVRCPLNAEEVTITTYYPAPEGVYENLWAEKYYGYPETHIPPGTPSEPLYGLDPIYDSYLNNLDISGTLSVDYLAATAYYDTDDPNFAPGSPPTGDYFIDPYPVDPDDPSIVVDGNVGIGTANPGNLLHLTLPDGTAGANTSIRLDSNYSSGNYRQDDGMYLTSAYRNAIISNRAEFVNGQWIARDPLASIVQLTNGGIYFHTNGSLTTGNPFTPTNRMIITEEGRVGIGTTAPPTARLEVNGDIKSPMWKVTQVFNSSLGPLPLSSTFSSEGGSLLIFASGSAEQTALPAEIGMKIKIDGVVRGYAKIYSNGKAGTHSTFTTNALVVTGITFGSHTLTLEEHNPSYCYTTSNDYFNVTVLELPFQP